MKRFFCTICGKVKRVRKYPASVDDSTNEVVALRKGTCKWHDAKFERAHMGWNTGKSAQVVEHAIRTNTPLVVIRKQSRKAVK